MGHDRGGDRLQIRSRLDAVGPKTATLVELMAVDGIMPLATAYLKMYARTDPDVARVWDITMYDVTVAVDREAILAELLARESDVYALSCYVWNMRLMRWLLDGLIEARPEAGFILGGPQVMRHASLYVSPDRTNVVVCDGEGERTFRAYLRELLQPEPDLSAVPGITFWRDGELVTTEAPERIRDLDEIPSPFTNGVFEPGRHNMAILETNRGCPYKCGFCFWGAATNSRVNRFESQRAMDDITWISENEYTMLLIADANWGLVQRDVDLTEHIVACAQQNGFPVSVSLNSAKNKQSRVAEIMGILARGGLLTSQPISLQTMDSDVLELVDRSNIRTEAYMELQRNLREQGISSYVEMIWPLPGETIETFKAGLTELCRSRAETIVIYPDVLLHNTPIYENREALHLAVRRVRDDVSEAEIIVSTDWVDEAEYETGVWIAYAVQALYNLRGLYYVANHLDRSGRMSFGETFAAAAAEFRRHEDFAIHQFFDRSVRDKSNYSLLNFGEVAYMTLHEHRDELDAMLAGFVSRHFGADPAVATMFELDLVARPSMYRDRRPAPSYPFEHLHVEPRPDGSLEVSMPGAAADLLCDLDLPNEPREPGGAFVLKPRVRRKLQFQAAWTRREHIAYCQRMSLHMREVVPIWVPLELAAVGIAR